MSATLDFDPSAAIVAGGSGDIGAEICRRLAQAGVPVHFSFRRNESAALKLVREIEAAGGRASCEAAELSDIAQVKRLFDTARAQYGRIGQVIYAAGPRFDFGFIGAIPPSEWTRVMDADLNGAFHFVQAAVREFRAGAAGGNLVAVITSAVERVPVRDILSAAPKAAIEMLIRGVAKECGRFAIRANCVGPGWVNAGLGKIGIDQKLTESQREAIRTQVIPLQRFGEAADIANAVLFLCSRQASYVTGQSLAVDGGLQL
jgi:NAD(P)-dependent dehydrogenase (short-subunit alcohol dehydrogenase family)